VTVYTSGDWYVKPGREDEFARLWREYSQTSVADVDPSAWQVLWRDRENPRHFRSMGQWRDEAAIVTWRDGTGFKHIVDQLREMLEEFSTSVFEIVESLGTPGFD
jgi:quinol monooxygenase YgiN